jgi:beta-N-acetylhexosaminidase
MGRLAIVGFSGHSVPAGLRELAAEFDLGGVIYFARNIVEPAQVRELSREVASLATDWPIWISVDQEGGRVARLTTPFTEWPPMATLGRSGDATLVARFASALAAELRAVGITLDFAPVLDIHTNPSNAVIGDRALSTRAEEVSRLGSAMIQALQAAGVAACGKHFPGHGDTTVDSHEGLPVVEHDRRRLEAVEALPFKQAVTDRVASIMTAHILVPDVDDRDIATFSRRIVTDWLKGALQFDGVVVSDDLGMKAVSATTPLPDASVRAVASGCDMLLLCNSSVDEQVTAIEALIHADESGDLASARLDDAWRRQHAVKVRMVAAAPSATPELDVIGCAAHQAVAREMAQWV